VRNHYLVLTTVLCALLQISISVCVAAEKPGFTAFMEMHEAHRNAVRTGMVRMRYTEYQFVPEAARRCEWEKEEVKAKIFEAPNLSPEEKEAFVSEMERSFCEARPKYFLASERTLDIYRDFIFDFSKGRFKLDEKPVDPDFFDQWGVDLDRVVLTLDDGTQVRYYRRFDQAVIHENAISDVAFMAEVQGAFLGVIGPRRLEDAPNNVVVFASSLDGQEIVVYEITGSAGRDVLRIWVDPSVGYRYRKIEFLRDGKVVERITAKDYKFFDGIAFPIFHEDIVYRDDPNRPVRCKKTIQVLEAKFNQELDPNAFKISFTPNSKVTCQSPLITFRPCSEGDCELTVKELLEKAKDLGG